MDDGSSESRAGSWNGLFERRWIGDFGLWWCVRMISLEGGFPDLGFFISWPWIMTRIVLAYIFVYTARSLLGYVD